MTDSLAQATVDAHDDQVEVILTENHYAPTKAPVPGDLAVYRDGEGRLHHVAVVRAVCDDGTVLVEGKWGWMGVYMHRLGDSLYGQIVTLLHSERRGHVLRVGPAGTVRPSLPAESTP